MATVWKLTFTTAAVEAAEHALELFGATIWATNKLDNGTAFEVYLEEAPDLDALPLPPDAKPQIEQLPNIDWVSESQKGLAPVIVPPFHLHGSHDAPRRGGWLDIEMQAGMAFGSGHHGTTKGCLTLLADCLKRYSPRHIADIGCGTGVLAIAGAKALPAFGANNKQGSILASDIDDVAVNVTKANIRLNRVAPRIRCFTAIGMAHPAYHGRRFDLILANILARPLQNLAADFEAALSPNGRIIVSGLLNEQARSVIARYRAYNLKVEQKIIIGPWTSLCFKR